MELERIDENERQLGPESSAWQRLIDKIKPSTHPATSVFKFYRDIAEIIERPYNSGENGYATHKWLADGNYEIKVKAKDSFGSESEWSEPRIGVVTKSYIFYRIPIIFQILKQLLKLRDHT